MDIYWIKDKQRRGPATVPDIVSLIQMGEITPDTKGWHTGVQGWKPLRELPALVDFLNDIPKAEAEPPAAQEQAGTALPGAEAPTPAPETGKPVPPPLPTPPQAKAGSVLMKVNLTGRQSEDINPEEAGLPSPGLRLLARLVDTALYFAAGLGVLYMYGAPYDCAFSPYGPYSTLFWLPMIVLEAFCLSKWGTTPGKKILGIYVCTFGPSKELTFGRAFMRSFFAFIMGMGMMLSLIPVVTMLISLWLLRSRGICWWDYRACTLPVRKRRTRASRVIFSVGALYFMIVLAGFFVQPWMKPMLEEISKASPETARLIEPFLNDATGAPAKTTEADKTGAVQEIPAGLHQAPAPEQTVAPAQAESPAQQQ